MILDHQINLAKIYYYYHKNINKVYDRFCFVIIITIIIINKIIIIIVIILIKINLVLLIDCYSKSAIL